MHRFLISFLCVLVPFRLGSGSREQPGTIPTMALERERSEKSDRARIGRSRPNRVTDTALHRLPPSLAWTALHRLPIRFFSILLPFRLRLWIDKVEGRTTALERVTRARIHRKTIEPGGANSGQAWPGPAAIGAIPIAQPPIPTQQPLFARLTLPRSLPHPLSVDEATAVLALDAAKVITAPAVGGCSNRCSRVLENALDAAKANLYSEMFRETQCIANEMMASPSSSGGDLKSWASRGPVQGGRARDRRRRRPKARRTSGRRRGTKKN